MIIRVPATSANIGCGFDSLGFAVNLYLQVEVLGETDVWKVEHDFGADIPTDGSNLIVQTANKVAGNLQPHHIKVTSDIPLERGLGSSSSALVAGVELANQLGKLNLPLDEKLQLACQLEGHPDNVAPAILGGWVASTAFEKGFKAVKLPVEAVSLVAYVPNYKMATEEMRKVLPKTLDYGVATKGSAICNVMLAYLVNGDFKSAGQMMKADVFHEPYRGKLMPELAQIRALGEEMGAYGTYLSGAGPTIMTLVPDELVADFMARLKSDYDGLVLDLSVDEAGVVVTA